MELDELLDEIKKEMMLGGCLIDPYNGTIYPEEEVKLADELFDFNKVVSAYVNCLKRSHKTFECLKEVRVKAEKTLLLNKETLDKADQLFLSKGLHKTDTDDWYLRCIFESVNMINVKKVLSEYNIKHTKYKQAFSGYKFDLDLKQVLYDLKQTGYEPDNVKELINKALKLKCEIGEKKSTAPEACIYLAAKETNKPISMEQILKVSEKPELLKKLLNQ